MWKNEFEKKHLTVCLKYCLQCMRSLFVEIIYKYFFVYTKACSIDKWLRPSSHVYLFFANEWFETGLFISQFM